MATEYATLTFVADTSGLERAENQLNAVTRTGTRTQQSVNKVSTSARAAGQSFNGLGRNAAQASVQIKSIIGPADTSAGSLLRLNNQASRVGAAAVKTGANVSGMGRNAGQAGIQIQQLVGQVQAGTNPLVAFSQQATDLGIVLGFPLLGAVAGLGSALVMTLIPALFDTSEASDDLKDRIEELTGGFDNLTAAQAAYFAQTTEDKIAAQKEEFRELNRQIKETQDDIDALSSVSPQSLEFFPANNQRDLEEARKTLLRLNAELSTLEGEIAANEEELARYNDTLAGNNTQTDEARQNAESFVQRLQEQADTIGLNREQTILYKAAQMELTDEQMRAIEVNARRIQQYYDEQEAQREADRQERERERERREREREAERRRREQEEARKKAEQERIEDARILNESLLAFEDQLMKGKSEKQKAAFRTAVNIMNAEKRERAANIVSTSYDAAMKAYAALAGIPIVGPALGAAAAATVIAAGVSYAAESLQGRALGGQVRAGESYVVGERGPEVLTMGTNTGRIIPNEAMRGSGGGEQAVNRTTNVTFQISTVDARGFDQLLQSRRGQIISMINSASNDRGRRAVV